MDQDTDQRRLTYSHMVSHKLNLPLLVLVTIVTLFFGLRPLDFFPENRVRWLDDQAGVQFYKQDVSTGRACGGVVYSKVPLDVGIKSDTFEPCTIEIYLEAQADRGGGLAHIVSFHDGYPVSSLVIGQWMTELIVRIRDNQNPVRDTYREIDLRDGLKANEQKVITIASGPERTEIYVNGELAQSYDIRALIGVEHFSGYLNLGNSSIGHNAWVGNLYGLALYDTLLTSQYIRQHYEAWAERSADMVAAIEPAPMILYTFAERTGTLVHNQMGNTNHLIIPSKFKALKTAMVMRFWRHMDWDRGDAEDILVNVAGFAPFALCMLMVLLGNRHTSPRRAAIMTVLASATLSLIIEIGQLALPTRTPSTLDLLCNTAGSALAVFLFTTIDEKKSSY